MIFYGALQQHSSQQHSSAPTAKYQARYTQLMPPKRVPTKSPVQTPPDYSDRRSLGLLDSLSPNYPSGMSQLRIRQQSLAVGKSVFSVLIWTTFLSLATLLASLTYLRHQQQFLTPSVALVLGGAPERERYAAQFALAHPTVEIWVSSGSNPEYAQWVFDQARVPTEQWHLDYRAVDTVTNFTTLIDELDARNIDEVYLLTSDYHMRRASVIAQIVLGSRGINFKPVSIPTEQPPERPETMVREVRDGARSLLWVVTGQTGSEWKNSFQKKS